MIPAVLWEEGGCATHGDKINNEKTELPDGALVLGFGLKIK